jgi:hypothetical protein
MRTATTVFAAVLLVGGIAPAQERVRSVPVEDGAPCSRCAPQAPVLDVARPPLPGEDGEGIAACLVLRSAREWARFCSAYAVPNCPRLDDGFFREKSVAAVVIDTVTPRVCEGTLEPIWRLACITPGRRAVGVRAEQQLAGEHCLCSAAPQAPERRFLAAAVDGTATDVCRACEEPHVLDCLR